MVGIADLLPSYCCQLLLWDPTNLEGRVERRGNRSSARRLSDVLLTRGRYQIAERTGDDDSGFGSGDAVLLMDVSEPQANTRFDQTDSDDDDDDAVVRAAGLTDVKASDSDVSKSARPPRRRRAALINTLRRTTRTKRTEHDCKACDDLEEMGQSTITAEHQIDLDVRTCVQLDGSMANVCVHAMANVCVHELSGRAVYDESANSMFLNLSNLVFSKSEQVDNMVNYLNDEPQAITV